MVQAGLDSGPMLAGDNPVRMLLASSFLNLLMSQWRIPHANAADALEGVDVEKCETLFATGLRK